MKFSCDRCHRRFSTQDDPVPDRVYRIGCKCGHLIVLGPRELAPPPLPAPCRAVPSPRAVLPLRAVPPPLPWARPRSPAALDEPHHADPAPAPSGPATTGRAPRPRLPELATTPTPPPLENDIPVLRECRAPSWAETLVRAGRASLRAGVAAWRSECTSSRALRVGTSATRWERTSWRTVLAASTASACVAALLATWLTTGTSRPPSVVTTLAIQPPTATTAAPAPIAAADGPGAVAKPDAPRGTLPFAPAGSARRVERTPTRSAEKTLSTVSPPAQASDGTEPEGVEETAAVVPEGEEHADGDEAYPTASAPPSAVPESAPPDSVAPESDGTAPETAAAAPAANKAAVSEVDEPPEGDKSSPATTPDAAGDIEQVAAKATMPSGGSSDDGSPSAPEVR